ncbi:threonine ammonia-lyase [Calderihabitans maritimus]|nr:threonine ammonia-lyase [Calderihabitans maritimus]
MGELEIVSLHHIHKALEELKPVIHRTPLDFSATFSKLTGYNVFLKAENLQKTGSFKIRGAYNKIQMLSPEEKKKGVVAASAGNHAQGVAFAASRAGIPSTVVMPQWAPLSKIMATRDYGARVVLAGENYDEAYLEARSIQDKTGAVFIHAFDDPAVIAGQGTVGLEIVEQLPDLDALVVPVGGGGLIAGIATAVKSLRPEVEVFGVQAARVAPVFARWKEGKFSTEDTVGTIADGIAVKRPGEITLPLIERLVDDIVAVEDEMIAQTILMLMERSKLIVEGAGAAALAAMLAGKVRPKRKNVVVIISGGNIDVNMVSKIIERGLVKTGRLAQLRTWLEDRPGALQKLLSVVASTRANVISVTHDRIKPAVPLTRAEVTLRLETKDTEHIAQIIKALQEKGYKVKELP